MNSDAHKKFALVTGAGNGIGKSICLHLEKIGYTIIAVSRNEKHLKEINDTLTNKEHLFFTTDLATKKGCIDLLQFLQKHGMPHVVVNNLRINSERKKLIGLSTAISEINIQENINHLLIIMSAVIDFQRQQKFGRWIGIGSMSNHFSVPGMAIYNMQKSMLEQLLWTLAAEEGKHGITANIVVPGLIATPSVLDNYSKEELDLRSQQNVLQRIGTTDEVASAVAFLASEDASYITGITLPVNGGTHLGWQFL
ncbi:MAG: SDR family oxidoreductase [Chitinophagales bacterium]